MIENLPMINNRTDKLYKGLEDYIYSNAQGLSMAEIVGCLNVLEHKLLEDITTKQQEYN